jgi:hypothetical protein
VDRDCDTSQRRALFVERRARDAATLELTERRGGDRQKYGERDVQFPSEEPLHLIGLLLRGPIELR